MDHAIVAGLIRDAFVQAKKHKPRSKSPGKRNRKKSEEFIRILREAIDTNLNSETSGAEKIAVLANTDENGTFRRSEYLFDIHAVAYELAKGARRVPVVTRSILQLECEFAGLQFEAAVDFGKLVCGRSDYKAMILPLLSTEKARNKFFELAESIARNVQGSLLVAFVPHPERWGKDDCASPEFYRAEGRKFVRLEVQTRIAPK